MLQRGAFEPETVHEDVIVKVIIVVVVRVVEVMPNIYLKTNPFVLKFVPFKAATKLPTFVYEVDTETKSKKIEIKQVKGQPVALWYKKATKRRDKQMDTKAK